MFVCDLFLHDARNYGWQRNRLLPSTSGDARPLVVTQPSKILQIDASRKIELIHRTGSLACMRVTLKYIQDYGCRLTVFSDHFLNMEVLRFKISPS